MMQEGFFDKTYYRYWHTESANDSFANIFAIHGLGGHCLWFDRAAQIFNKKNINFFSFDLPGFGQSKFQRGIISSYKIWLEVTKQVLHDFLIKFNLRKPVFILGHSMGALLAIMLSKKVKSNGWILSVPGFEGYYKTWPLLSFVIPALLKSVFKSNENIILPFGPELLTKNKETQLKVKQDSLRVVNPSAGMFMQVYLLALVSKLSCKSITEPVLMLMAGKDQVCSNPSIETYFNEIKSKDKSKKTYTNAFHDLFIEDELEEIAIDISNWIKERCK